MQLQIDGLSVTVLRKPIKNMHLRVLPPDGSVQITAPGRLPVAQIERFVREKRGWIARQQALILSQPPVTDASCEDGQRVYLWGQSFTLRLEHAARRRDVLCRGQEIVLLVRPDDTPEKRLALLNSFYRAALQAQIERQLPIWEERSGLHPSSFQIKNMTTRWGTCNTRTKKIWFNLQLAKQPSVCLDYIIAHELTHLRYGGHGADFKAFLTRLMPDWPEIRKQLNEKTYL